jgi:hypothetical protein
MTLRRMSLALLGLLAAVTTRGAATSDLTLEHPIGLFADMLADTVTSELFHHFEPTPQIAFTVVSPVLGGAVIGDARNLVVADLDGDGDDDVVVCNAAAPGDPPTQLLVNDGHGRFRAQSVAGMPASTSAGCAADFDNDGRPDLVLVTMPRGPRTATWEGNPPGWPPIQVVVLRNLGSLKFAAVAAVTLPPAAEQVGGAVADLDGDGYVDLLLVSIFATGSPATQLYRGSTSGLLLATGDLVTRFAELGRHFHAREFGQFAAVDVDQDGDLDLLAQSVQFFPDRRRPLLWLENRRGAWQPLAEFPLPPLSRQMVPQFIDIDNDGDLDAFAGVADIDGGRNQLYVNHGDGRWEDRGRELGLHGGYTYTRSAAWGDWDNDGWLDLLAVRSANESAYTTSLLLVNREGRYFVNASACVEGELGGSSGSAVACDVDGDGDLDLLHAHLTDYLERAPMASTGVRLLRNDSRAGHWLAVELVGVVSNRAAIGATLRLRAGGPSQLRAIGPVILGSSSPARAHFGLGAATRVDSLLVTWPSGLREVWTDLAGDRRLVLREGSGARPPRR